MGAVNVEILLKPVSEDKPCGEDFRYNARFLEVLRMAETGQVQEIGKPGEPGYKRIEPEEPSWRDVRDGCLELLSQTKHLSLCFTLCLCQVKMEGYAGLRDALALTRGLLDQRWDTIYPVLDPDDNLDPLERSNILSSMSAQIGNPDDRYRFLERTRDLVVCESPRVGRIRHRDIVAALGEVVEVVAPTAEGEAPKPKLDLPIIDAAFSEADPASVEATAVAIEGCVAEIIGINAAFKTGMTSDYNKLKEMGRSVKEPIGGPSLERLQKLLEDAAKQVRKRIPGAAAAAGGAADGAGGGGGGGGDGGGQTARLAGEVRSTDDVMMALEKIIQYYSQYEPSSPVGLIVVCAKKMVRKNFLDISRVLTSSEVSMLEKISTTE